MANELLLSFEDDHALLKFLRKDLEIPREKDGHFTLGSFTIEKHSPERWEIIDNQGDWLGTYDSLLAVFHAALRYRENEVQGKFQSEVLDFLCEKRLEKYVYRALGQESDQELTEIGWSPGDIKLLRAQDYETWLENSAFEYTYTEQGWQLIGWWRGNVTSMLSFGGT